MITQVIEFFDNALVVLQGLWSWCVETHWTIGDFTFTPISVFSTGLLIFLGLIVIFKIKNLII